MTRRMVLAILGSIFAKFKPRSNTERLASRPIKYGGAAIPASLTDLQNKVGPGWAGTIERLVADLFALGWDGEVLQVKEKFGGLRFYINAQTDEMWERAILACEESVKICEDCGAPGILRNVRGWRRTLCARCGSELVVDAIPQLAQELESSLREQNYYELAAQVPKLRIVERCPCDGDFCATFYTQPKPEGSFGPGLRNVVLAPEKGWLILDVVGGIIMCVEILDRPEIRKQLLAVLP